MKKKYLKKSFQLSTLLSIIEIFSIFHRFLNELQKTDIILIYIEIISLKLNKN